MPVRMTTNIDMALEEYDESFFFDRDDEEEVFYEDGFSKDLWKKFELHTPPQSPPHNPFPPDNDKTVDKCLQKVFLSLDYGDESAVKLNSNLIQDCMWSGPCLAAAGLISPSHKSDKLKSKVSLPSCNSDMSSVSSDSNVDINSAECVSPAAVFPYPVNEPPKKVELSTFSLGSVAETPSPSESEDEEIDVVTVVAEKMSRKRHSGQTSTSQSQAEVASFKSHVAAIHNYSNTHSHPAASSSSSSSFSAPQSPQSASSPRDSSCNGHKRSRPMSMPASPQPAKKSRSLLQTTDLKRVVQKLKLGHQSSCSSSSYRYQTSSSRNSSDSEEGDTNKRAQHNVLERKRRNDLKYSFLKLRDNVPELAKQERTPKVTILKQSADYVRSVTLRNKQLENELTKTKIRYENMKRKLMALRRECL